MAVPAQAPGLGQGATSALRAKVFQGGRTDVKHRLVFQGVVRV